MSNFPYAPPFPWDLDALPFVALADHATLPSCAGVYFVRTATKVVYVGATNNLHSRTKYHEKLAEFRAWPGECMIAWMPLPTRKDTFLRICEWQAIAHYHPILNIEHTEPPRPRQNRRTSAIAFDDTH